jgi:hypothetical protein
MRISESRKRLPIPGENSPSHNLIAPRFRETGISNMARPDLPPLASLSCE